MLNYMSDELQKESLLVRLADRRKLSLCQVHNALGLETEPM